MIVREHKINNQPVKHKRTLFFTIRTSVCYSNPRRSPGAHNRTIGYIVFEEDKCVAVACRILSSPNKISHMYIFENIELSTPLEREYIKLSYVA